MDNGTTIMGICILALLVLPFIISYTRKTMKHKNLMRFIREVSEKEKLKISQYQMWEHNYIIGIDTESGKLIYFNKKENKKQGIVINLPDVAKCRIISTDQPQKKQSGDASPAYRLDLILTLNNSSDGEMVLEFYNSIAFSPSSEDFSIIKKWSDIVNSNLKS
jgi:hypothetical protein